MATGSEAIEAIAQATGIALVTVGSAAKILKQHEPPLYARSKRGGGRGAAHVTPTDLTNLMLALCITPLTDAPKAVTSMRALLPSKGGFSTPFLPGDTLGAALDNLIDACSTDRGLSSIIEEVLDPDIEVTRFGKDNPYVTMGATNRDNQKRMMTRLCEYQTANMSIRAAADAKPTSALTTSVRIPFALIRILSELWADTRRRRGAPLLQI
jgi:hypothetical protein